MFRELMIVVFAEVLVSSAPRGSIKDCESSLSYEVLTSKEQAQQSLRSTQELNSDETAIYYEPAELDPGEPRVYSNYPFYIINPARKLIVKTPSKRGATMQEKYLNRPIPGHNAPDTTNILIPQDTPLYLDVDAHDQTGARNIKEENFKGIENNILECLDLHILVFNRKSSNVTESKKLLDTNKLNKYETMSDADIIMAIQSKCSTPVDIMNRSVQEVKESQPKKNSKFNANSNSLPLELTSSDLPLELTTSTSRLNEISEFLNNNDVEDGMVVSESKTREKQADGSELESSTSKSNMDDTAAAETTHTATSTGAVPLDENQNRNEENEIVKTEVSTTERTLGDNITSPIIEMNTITSIDRDETKIDNETVEESTDVKPHTLNQPKTEITDSHLAAQTVNLSESTISSFKDFKESETDEQKVQLVIHKTDSSVITTESYQTPLPSQDTKPFKKNLFKNFVNVSIQPFVPHDEEITELANDTIIEKEPDAKVRTSNHSLENNMPIATHRPKYEEKAIKIPKIVSKEFGNGSVISSFDGYEVLPNNDFKLLNDSYEDNSVDASNVGVLSTEPQEPRDITGKLYFVFDEHQVPARFVQDTKGEIHVGIDAKSLCDKLQSENSDLLLFSKLCTFVSQSDSTKIN